jgi:hypothetical protein
MHASGIRRPGGGLAGLRFDMLRAAIEAGAEAGT